MLVKVPLCLDGRMLAARATGVATYARTVRAALAEAGAPPLILDDAMRGRFGETRGRWRRWWRARSGAPVRLVAEPGGLFAPDVFALAQARFARTGEVLRLRAPGPPGVIHWTYPVAAMIEGWRNLYTIHDVIPLTHPELVATDPAALRARLHALRPYAAGYLTVSEHSRGEIVQALGIAFERVVSAGLAVIPPQAVEMPLPAELTRGGYFLFHGLAEPRKNLRRIVAAWRASGTARALVIAGPDGGEAVDTAGAIRLAYLERAELLALVAGARALAFPSLAEGFGLPIAEAMAAGTPVLTSAGGACAETAGAAALLVDPTDVEAIAAAIRRLDRDDALCAQLAEAGRARAEATFGLGVFGERLLRAYADLIGDSAPAP